MEKNIKKLVLRTALIFGVLLSIVLGAVTVKNGSMSEKQKFEELNEPSRGNIYGFDINEADAEDFMTIKGIGEVYSKNIIEKREEMGGFKYVDDLIYVDKIGAKRLEMIKPYVRVK